MSINFKEATKDAVKLLSELIKIDTSNPPGNEMPAAQLVAEMLKNYGYEPIIIESDENRGNVIVKLEGKGEGPSLLLLSHLDVVPADPSKWSFDPFSGEIKDGYVLGRGAIDCKGLVAIEATIMRLLAEEKVAPKGDVIFAATADEERGGVKGVKWLVENEPDLILADYVINEGGGAPIKIYDKVIYTIQVAEKGIFWVKIRTKGKAVHASIPYLGENAIEKMSEIISRLKNYKSPVKITYVVKDFIEGINKAMKNPILDLALSPNFVDSALNVLSRENKVLAEMIRAMIRNTFTPTMIKGGLKENIIPSECELSIDCRLLPEYNANDLVEELRNVLRGLDYEIEVVVGNPGSESPYDTELYKIMCQVINEFVPNSIVVPLMSPGATDSRYLRDRSICYGIWPFSPETTMEKIIPLVHGIDERISIKDIEFGIRVLYEIVKRLMY